MHLARKHRTRVTRKEMMNSDTAVTAQSRSRTNNNALRGAATILARAAGNVTRAAGNFTGAVAVISLSTLLMTSSYAAKSDKIDELVGMHDLKTSVAIGDYYLKQRALFAIRDELKALGKAENLGPDWNPSNPFWQQAEQTLMADVGKRVNHDFASLEWLSEEWTELDDHDFTEEDIDKLLTHFKTEFGRKQVMIVDHGVALHVQSALTFTGKMVYEVPGLERYRDRMQALYNDEDQEMRFNIDDSPEGVRFAMSPTGKRYFVNAMLNVSGMISRRLDQTAAALPQTVKGLAGEAQPAVQAFQRKRREG